MSTAATGTAQILNFGIGPGALRLLLALIVVLFHMTRWVPFGHTAVYLFFVLSGYWMSHSYQQVYAQTRQPLWTYAVSRILRLYPLYLLALLLSVLLWLLFADALEAARLLAAQARDPHLVVRNALIIGLDAYPQRWLIPAWSLDIEWQFYILLPALLYWRRRCGDRLLVLLIPLSLLAFVWRQHSGQRSYLLEFLWLFMAGMLMHRGGADRTSTPPWSSKRLVVVCTGLAALCAVLPFLAWPAPWAMTMLPSPDTTVATPLRDSWNLLLALLLLPLLEHNVRGASSARDHRFGAAAYPLYLLHWPLLVVCGGMLNLATTVLEKRLWLLAYVLGGLLLAMLVQRLFDAPIDAWRRRWVASRWRSAGTIQVGPKHPTPPCR